LMQETGADEIHRKSADGVDKVHEVFVERKSLLFEITQTPTGRVNSAHHQAARIGSLGNNLMVNAWYMDGDDDDIKVIEGLEYEDKTGKAFMLGVQWHPERMKDRDNSPLSKKIRERFIKEISK
jgi:putative glutamine amidotransferase